VSRGFGAWVDTVAGAGPTVSPRPGPAPDRAGPAGVDGHRV